MLTPIDLYFSVQLYIDSAIGFQNTLQAPGSSRLGVQPGIEELCGEELDGGVPVCWAGADQDLDDLVAQQGEARPRWVLCTEVWIEIKSTGFRIFFKVSISWIAAYDFRYKSVSLADICWHI